VTETLPLDLECQSATFSKCGLYRYDLRRIWRPDARPLLWIMLNPSTADAVVDDPTVKRCTRFAVQWGHGGIVVCNLFAFRSTKPEGLLTVDDPVGLDKNDEVIAREAAEAYQVVVAWGSHGDFMGRGRQVYELIREKVGRSPLCLGTTKAGEPRHPLYVPKTKELRLFYGYDDKNKS